MAMMLLAGEARRRRFVSYSMLRIRASVLQVCRTSSTWADMDPESFTQALEKFLGSTGRNLYWDCRSFPRFFGDRITSQFLENERLRGDHPTAVNNDGRWNIWTWLPDSAIALWKRPEGRCLCLLGGVEKLANDMSKGLQALIDQAPHSGNPEYHDIASDPLPEDDGSLIISPLALFTCMGWLEDEAGMAKLDFDNKGNVRNALAHQLTEVDFWLRFHGGPEAACEVRRILDDLQEPSTTVSAQGNQTSSIPPDPPPLHKRASGSMQEASNRVTAADGLRVFLVYRAVLVAALYATAADVSCVEGTELGQRIVRIL